MPFNERDRGFMAQALRLAALGRGRTHPNPMVGCVLVKDGQVVGTGYHRKAGEPHAEVHALRAAGEQACGATAYVTLEPCAHYGRTPPCTDALAAARVERVVAAMVDPDPRVAGKGLERLRAAGITVESGLLEKEAATLNRAWLTWKKKGRPLVILKWAMTLDGKIGCASGDSRWVTGEVARNHAHQIRDQVDAILVGGATVRIDNPELTARPSSPGPLPGWAGGLDPGPDETWRPKDPLRIVLDSAAYIDPNARLLAAELQQRPLPNQTLVATTCRASPKRLAAIRDRAAEVLVLPEHGSAKRAPLEQGSKELAPPGHGSEALVLPKLSGKALAPPGHGSEAIVLPELGGKALAPTGHGSEALAPLELSGEALTPPEQAGGVALKPLLDELGARGITSLLVEGGGQVHWSFLSQDLADYVMIYLAPKAVGGATAPGPVAGEGLIRMADAWELASAPKLTPLGFDLLLEGDLKRGDG